MDERISYLRDGRQGNIDRRHANRVQRTSFYYTLLKSAIKSRYDRRADAITQGIDGKNYFVEPWVENMRMKDLLPRLENGEHSS